jgi:hypothetical protein
MIAKCNKVLSKHKSQNATTVLSIHKKVPPENGAISAETCRRKGDI